MKKTEVLLESIDMHQSEHTTAMLVEVGEILIDRLMQTERYDDSMILDELIGAFAYAAECYGEKTGALRPDLGISLRVASGMKTDDLRKNGKITSDEWRHFAQDAANTIRSTT